MAFDMTIFFFHSKIHWRVPNHRSQQSRYSLYRNGEISMSSFPRSILSKGSRIPAEENHVQFNLSFLAAAKLVV